MRSLIILVLLAAALILGIDTAITGVYDGRTLLAILYVAAASVLHYNRKTTES